MSASFLTETVHVSRAVFRMLETLSMQQAGEAGDDRPLTTGVDAIADAMLRAQLEAQPGMAERQRRIAKFFRELDKEAQ